MKKIKISIAGKGPSSFLSSRAVSNVEETLDYIPGSSLRGALAKLWLKTYNLDNNFKAIFTEDSVHFCNLYKDGAKLIPQSALSCKYHSGFTADSDPENEKHGVVDILLPLIREKNNEFPSEYQKCKTCYEPLKKYRGYYNDFFRTIAVSKRLIYHSSISEITETSEDKSLYSIEVIEKEQKFKTEIFVYDESLLDTLYKFIKIQNIIFLGSDKTRGLGQFRKIHSSIDESQIEISEFKKRINDFNKKLGLEDGRTYFSITLQSDAIITDHFMRYKTIIEPEDIGIEDAKPVLEIGDHRIISGWNSLLKLPKDDSIAIVKGSVFVLSVDSFIDSKLEILYDIEMKGIGKRKGEGFGRVTVCDKFHYEGSDIK